MNSKNTLRQKPGRLLTPSVLVWIVGFFGAALSGLSPDHPMVFASSLVCLLIGTTGALRAMPEQVPVDEIPISCEKGHALNAISAQPISYGTDRQRAAVQWTVVLYRCTRCGLHQSHMVGGEWSIADIIRMDSEVSELERMAGR